MPRTRMKRRRRYVRGTAVAAALMAIPYAQTAAQTTMVENIDEPARNPYQETIFAIQGLGAGLYMTYSAVPAQTRRVVTHASCNLNYESDKYRVCLVTISANAGFQTEVLPPVGAFPSPLPTHLVPAYSANPQLYLEAGQSPVIAVSSNDPKAEALCRLSGYDIALPPPTPPAGQ